MSQFQFFKVVLFSVVALLLLCSCCVADTFTFVTNSKGDEETVEARLAGSGKIRTTDPKCHALELANGSIRVIPQVLITKRVPGEDPKPISHEALGKEIQKTFPDNLVLIHIDKPYVIAMILENPRQDKRMLKLRQSQLKKSGKYFKSVQSKFLKFIRRTKVQAQAIKYPLPVLIFDTDEGFEQYASTVTGNKGLSSKNILGFYSSTTNYLNLRIRECTTFETPLHEAIHQQTFNRQILQRLAPLPAWFVEGIACGFEGDGHNIKSGPTTPRLMYAKRSVQARAVNWEELIQHDRAFRGDIFAGEAYSHAWGLHWLLVTKHKRGYAKYVQLLSSKKTLESYSPEDRLKDFEEIMGKKTTKLQQQFHQAVVIAINKRR